MTPKRIVTSVILSASLAVSLVGTAVAGDAERGDGLANTCVACHGPGGNSNIPSMYPSIAGRDASDLVRLITAYRDGDINEPQMSPQAQGLSDQDIKDIAAYFASQEEK